MRPSASALPILLALLAATAANATACAGAEPHLETLDGAAEGTMANLGVQRPGLALSSSRSSLEAARAEHSPLLCYDSFQPGLDPAADLVRLTSACAGAGGFTAVTPVHVGEPQGTQSAAERLSFRGHAGRCYRVFSVGEPGVTDLDVAILDEEGRIAAADLSGDRFPVVPPRGSLCLNQDQRFIIQVGVMQGSGGYLLQVWGS